MYNCLQRYCNLSEIQNKLGFILISDKKKEVSSVGTSLSVGVLGLEPRMTGPESVVLPLHHTPINPCNFHLRVQRYYFFWNYQNFSEKKFTIDLKKTKKRDSHMEISFLRYDYSSLFSASMALIFSRTRFISSLSFCTLRFISSIRLLPFLEEAFRKPRLFS